MIDLDAMPLDTREHIRAAWDLMHKPLLLASLREQMQPAEARTAVALVKDRIQLAAVEHGMGLLPGP